MKLLEKFFPVPDFLRMPAIGLDISDRSIKYAKIRHNMRHIPVLRDFGVVRLPENAIENGVIKKPELVIEKLAEVRDITGMEFVHVALPEEKVWLFQLQLPKVPVEEIEDAILFQINEYVPITKDDVVFDYAVIATDTHTVTAQVHATKKDLVHSYIDILQAAGFTPIVFELEAQATVRSIQNENSEQPYLAIDIGENRSTISLVHKNTVVSIKSLETSGTIITQKIADALSVSFKDAESLKTKVGLESSEQKSTKLEEATQAIIKRASQVFVDAIKDYASNWQQYTKDTSQKLSRVVVYGGGANMFGLMEYLEEKTGIRVERARIVQLTNSGRRRRKQKNLSLSKQLVFATAIGLGLEKKHHD